jgi:N-hydroxyarylamine O-acetyltransferase
MTVLAASPVESLEDAQVAAYLDRIGLDSAPERGEAGLRQLHLHHLLAVPFENLSIHLGQPISLARDDLFDKIVVQRRGGFCYELNGLFAALLTSLGYSVSLLQAGVYGPNGIGPPFDHLVLLVDGWLCDVGFGKHTAYPLRLDSGVAQDDPCGSFTVTTTPTGDLEVARNGAGQYRIEVRSRTLAEFAPTCWWQQTYPSSHFRNGPVCSRMTPTFGLVTLADHTLIVTEGDVREQTTLSTDAEVLAAYRDRFGLVLDRPPVPVGAG